jgi:hypothetical protein
LNLKLFLIFGIRESIVRLDSRLWIRGWKITFYLRKSIKRSWWLPSTFKLPKCRYAVKLFLRQSKNNYLGTLEKW